MTAFEPLTLGHDREFWLLENTIGQVAARLPRAGSSTSSHAGAERAR